MLDFSINTDLVIILPTIGTLSVVVVNRGKHRRQNFRANMTGVSLCGPARVRDLSVGNSLMISPA